MNITELALLKIEQLYKRISKLEDERDAAMRETSALREGITKAIGMEWRKIPQPLGGNAEVCPDDKDIIAACAALKGDR